ncbi:hypothetical protein IP69_06085 [Bosea sp. AAP35]|nr:hypothetical protein IP69_06085 [Bosea sp. AAP35]
MGLWWPAKSERIIYGDEQRRRVIVGGDMAGSVAGIGQEALLRLRRRATRYDDVDCRGERHDIGLFRRAGCRRYQETCEMGIIWGVEPDRRLRDRAMADPGLMGRLQTLDQPLDDPGQFVRRRPPEQVGAPVVECGCLVDGRNRVKRLVGLDAPEGPHQPLGGKVL